MGKMPLRDQERGRAGERSAAQRGVKLQQLLVRESQEEALEKDNGFAKAGVEVVVGGVEQFPFALRFEGGGVAAPHTILPNGSKLV